MIAPVSLNYLALIVSTVFAFVLGWIWYGPLFGKPWMKLAGITPKGDKMKGMFKIIIINLVTTFVLFWVMAHATVYAGATTFAGGALVGFMNWLGFIATTSMGMVLWEGKSWKLYAINVGYYLVTFVVGGALLAGW